MPNKWDELARKATESTNEQFKSEISSLTRLNDNEVEKIIMQTGISKLDLAAVLKEVKDATKSNSDKAKAIKNISKGMDVIVGFLAKLI